MDRSQLPLRLGCAVQRYDWGRASDDSTVARLISRNNTAAYSVDPAGPFAEFWIGTHPSGPSITCHPYTCVDVPLKTCILENPIATLGDDVAGRWGGDLPFLFKVLSVSKALSIQAHPDKELAELLHKTRPDIYKDSNHKPEMAIALTEFEALCGFVALEELKDVLTSVPELREMVGDESADRIKSIKETDACEDIKVSLKLIYTKLMSTDNEVVSEFVAKLNSRLNMESKVRMLTEKEQLALRLEEQYSGDIGVISSFFFNYVKLHRGQALYIGANEPHAYLSGECIECMATSDNVVRAGLTPKYKDVQTLCSMLTYKQGFPEILQGTQINESVTRYAPPFDEFEVDWISLPSGETVVCPAIPGPSIFLAFSGEGSMLFSLRTPDYMLISEGHVFFIPAMLEIKITGDPSVGLVLFRAGVNSRVFD